MPSGNGGTETHESKKMNRKQATDSAFRDVLLREWERMTSRRLYFGVCVVLPLFVLFFMSTIFGTGTIERVPVAVVDLDHTATSRQVARNITAVPTVKVTQLSDNEYEARRAMQAKEIYGYVVLPPKFEEYATSGRGATVSYYYQLTFLSVGNELLAGLTEALTPVALSPVALQAVAAGGLTEERAETFLLPIQGSDHPVYNPSLDYTIYLGHPFFYVLFQILILLTTMYTVGGELKFHTADHWLLTARGNMVTALLAKLLPYTVIYTLIAILANFVLFRIVHIPFCGSYLMMNLVTFLFIVATQSLGGVPVLPVARSLPGHERRLYGGVAGSYVVGSHLSGNKYVYSGVPSLFPFSGTALYDDHADHALFSGRVWLLLAFHSGIVPVSPDHPVAAPPPEGSHNQTRV